MAQLEVDFEVWKELTARRDREEQTYNDVLREMLGLPTAVKHISKPLTSEMMIISAGGRELGGRYLPQGTLLRARYKGALHEAEIRDGKLIGKNGKSYSSASAAARAVTKNNVNGLTFWEVRRPSDEDWQKLVALPRRKP